MHPIIHWFPKHQLGLGLWHAQLSCEVVQTAGPLCKNPRCKHQPIMTSGGKSPLESEIPFNGGEACLTPLKA